jgi:hypothetical protein
MQPLCIDLFCGLGGWAEGFLSEGYDVIGFDVERHYYGTGGYLGQLVLQDVLTLDGRQFERAAVIVASPPCQAYSYMAMPWSRAKALAREREADARLQLELNCLFNACFRIAHQAGVPLIVENVRGAERWVGPARWHFGSFYLWGDVPALMPMRFNGAGGLWFNIGRPGQKAVGLNPDGRKVPGFRFDGSGKSFQTASVNGTKSRGIKLSEVGFNVRNAQVFREYGGGFGPLRSGNSKADSRKAASAQIAKIPFPLASHIARVFKP